MIISAKSIVLNKWQQNDCLIQVADAVFNRKCVAQAPSSPLIARTIYSQKISNELSFGNIVAFVVQHTKHPTTQLITHLKTLLKLFRRPFSNSMHFYRPICPINYIENGGRTTNDFTAKQIGPRRCSIIVAS